MSFYNLCMHNQDYSVQATWSFLALFVENHDVMGLVVLENQLYIAM